jgi:hypothetical protein
MARQFGLVLYGATGFTGKEVCKYICRTCTDNIKWAIAGRSQSKLGQLKSQLLAAAGSTGNLPDILVSDADDTRTLQAMFAETRGGRGRRGATATASLSDGNATIKSAGASRTGAPRRDQNAQRLCRGLRAVERARLHLFRDRVVQERQRPAEPRRLRRFTEHP